MTFDPSTWLATTEGFAAKEAPIRDTSHKPAHMNVVDRVSFESPLASAVFDFTIVILLVTVTIGSWRVTLTIAD